MMRIRILVLLLLVLPAIAPAQEKHWYKGNLHTHTLWSDGDHFPEMAADWYKGHGYDFVALSDHNVLSVGEKWVAVRDVERKGGEIAVRSYRERFPDVVQTRHTEEKGEEIRLQPLEKVRALLEEPGKFILIQAEEVSDRLGDKPVHMGAINVGEVVEPQHGHSVREVIANNFRVIEEQSKRLDRPIVAHVNHPNFGWGVSAEDLAAVVEERYFEVYNGHPIVHHLGDATHPGDEKIWDIANTIRLAQLNAEPLMGFGCDDTHHYHVTGMSRSTAGRGWVMVLADKLTPDAITAALKRGDFYASSGVTLKDVRFDAGTKTISVEIKIDDVDGDGIPAEPADQFTTQFIGTPKNFARGGKTPLDSADVGKVLATASGTKATYTLSGHELYVRAVITSSKAHPNPSVPDQKQQAWTQPVGWGAGSSNRAR